MCACVPYWRQSLRAPSCRYGPSFPARASAAAQAAGCGRRVQPRYFVMLKLGGIVDYGQKYPVWVNFLWKGPYGGRLLVKNGQFGSVSAENGLICRVFGQKCPVWVSFSPLCLGRKRMEKLAQAVDLVFCFIPPWGLRSRISKTDPNWSFLTICPPFGRLNEWPKAAANNWTGLSSVGPSQRV